MILPLTNGLKPLKSAISQKQHLAKLLFRIDIHNIYKLKVRYICMRKRRKNSAKFDALIEEFGEENIVDYIQKNLFFYDEQQTRQIKSIEELKDLTKEQLEIFKEEYEEYLDNTILDEEELEGWNDILEKINKD